MTNIAVFEDQDVVHKRIQYCLLGTEHKVVAAAKNIVAAHDLLGEINRGTIKIGALLIDGTLQRGYGQPVFKYELPQEMPETPMQHVLRLFIGKEPEKKIRTVALEDSEYLLGSDARHIMSILRVLKIDVPTIGISGQPMSDIGVSVDYDLGKRGIEIGLVTILDTLDINDS